MSPGLHGSRPGLTWDTVKAEAAVKKQAVLGARILCPGHGPAVLDAADMFPTELAISAPTPL